MKTLSAALQAHIEGEEMTLATCWKLTRRDSAVMGFTDHDANLTVSSQLYQASTGFTPSAVSSSAGLSVDNLEVDGMLSAGAITEADILAGYYDFAEIEIFMVNYADLTQGTLPLRRGWLGEVSLSSGQFVAEVRGLSQRLSQNIGELYSPSCRAALGDSRCKVNLTTHTYTGSVTTGGSRYQIIDSALSDAAGLYTFGKITFTSGANNGLSMEVKEHRYDALTGATLLFALPLPNVIDASVTFSLIKGCDKTIATCVNRFNNVVNFRGEPHVPGLDKMLETAGTRSG